MTKKHLEGSLLRIDLQDGTSCFARVLTNSQIAAYACRFPSESAIDLSKIYGSEVLFTITIMRSGLDGTRWPAVDRRPLEAEFLEPTYYFVRDDHSGEYSIYRSPDGSMSVSTFEECKDLEAAAVWDPEHVEDRLSDHFAGRKNRWVDELRAKVA